MKRCIICGNECADESRICEICGNPFSGEDDSSMPDPAKIQEEAPQEKDTAGSEAVEPAVDKAPDAGAPDGRMPEGEAGDVADDTVTEEAALPSGEQEAKTEEAGTEKALRVRAPLPGTSEAKKDWPDSLFQTKSAAENPKPEGEAPKTDAETPEPSAGQTRPQQERRPRRMKSGPHIYGQAETGAEAYRGAQGVIRREVKGGRQEGGAQAASAEALKDPSVQRTASDQGNARIRRAGGTQTGRPTHSGNHAVVRGTRPAARETQTPEREDRSAPVRQMNGETDGFVQNTPTAVRSRGSSFGRSRTVGIAVTSRKLLASPLFLLVTLLQTVYTASSVAAIFLHELDYSQIARLLSDQDIPNQLKSYVSSATDLLAKLDSGAIGVNFAIRVPDILFCLGLWIVWLVAHTKKERMTGVGFRLMRFVTIINMIVSCIVLLLVLILSVTLVIATWGAGTKSMATMAVIVLVAAVAVTMAVVMYYFCYLVTIRACQMNSTVGELYGRASGYVAFWHMLMSLTSVITILSGIVNLEITGIVGGVGGLGWRFLFGLWIFRYAGRMKEYNS